MISEVDFRCVDCKRSIDSLHYKRLKTLVQRCRPCFKAWADGRCCYSKRGVQCPFKPDHEFARFCYKHAIYETATPKPQQRNSRQSSYTFRTPGDLPNFNFTDSDFPSSSSSSSSSSAESSSSSSSPPRSRRSHKSKEPKYKHEDSDFQTTSSMKLFDIKSRSDLSAVTSRELKRIYLNKALSLHPDKNIGIDTTEQFQKLNAAYEYLKDYVAR